jgi:hypothetical protein
MRCKVINSNKNTLEEKINEWLNTDIFEIFNVVQTQDDEYITITFLYYDKLELRKLKLEKLNDN